LWYVFSEVASEAPSVRSGGATPIAPLIDGLDKQHQATARRVLERLVSVETGEYARRRAPMKELEAADQDENVQ
jgi:hypothetical protein